MNNELATIQNDENPVVHKLYELGANGNVDAIKELNIVNFRHTYNRMLDEMDEDNM